MWPVENDNETEVFKWHQEHFKEIEMHEKQTLPVGINFEVPKGGDGGPGVWNKASINTTNSRVDVLIFLEQIDLSSCFVQFFLEN